MCQTELVEVNFIYALDKAKGDGVIKLARYN